MEMDKAKNSKNPNYRPQGQGGPKLQLRYMELTARERVVLDAIVTAGQPITLGQLAEICFSSQPKAKRNSWVRNQLRRLVRASFVHVIAPGLYQPGIKARNSVKRTA